MDTVKKLATKLVNGKKQEKRETSIKEVVSMDKMKQSQATFLAIVAVFKDHDVQFTPGQDASKLLTKEMREEVRDRLVEGFQNGTIELKKTYESEADYRSYASGLISNWLRKDKRLNGNVAYTPKNPGSRRGKSDPQLAELRKLRTVLTDEDEIAEVDAAIAAREAQISAAKAPQISIELLLEHLRAFVQKSA